MNSGCLLKLSDNWRHFQRSLEQSMHNCRASDLQSHLIVVTSLMGAGLDA